MESLYGGRQGASTVIVKHFDGVDIPQTAGSYVYKVKSCAVNTEGLFILDSNDKFIERTASNYSIYKWKLLTLNGKAVDIVNSRGEIGKKITETSLAEGMRQCFEKGGDTTNIVNYGECVIIDTIINLNNFNSPDNGKVYRRGLNFVYDPVSNPLAGAEYIGQIVGPQGRVGLYEITSESEAKQAPESQTRLYTSEAGDLIPGKYIDDQGQAQYNDNVSYSWGYMRDEGGDLEKCLFGFTIPYHVTDFTSKSVDPYYHRSNQTKNFENLDLIEEQPSEHPFYQQWKISIPKGKKGDCLNNLEIYPTMAKKGSPYWYDNTLSGDPIGELTENLPIINYDKDKNYLVVNVGNINAYVSKDNGWKERIRYKETNYDKSAEGESQYIDIGEHDTVSGVSISDNGNMIVTYTYRDPQVLAETLKWLYYEEGVEASGIELASNGSIIVHYNTGETQEYENWLTWITEVKLEDNGDFVIKYNNNKIAENSEYRKRITWIAEIQVNENGDVIIKNNDGTIAATYEGYLRTIIDVSIDTGVEEGSGSQKLQIKYNNSEEKISIGNPLNYVIETVVSEYNDMYPNTPGFHLLVLYSDPEKRAALADPKTYYSSVLGKVMTGWADLGYVRGVPGGLHIIGNYNDVSELYRNGVAIPPQNLTTPANPEYAGWGVTVKEKDIYVYDYITAEWYTIGNIVSAATPDPAKIITISNTEPITLVENGIWLVGKNAKYAG